MREGIASVREYLVERQEQLQGRRPSPGELMVTSGGMECITLMCQALIDPGDTVAVEAPTYLAALMAFGRAEARPVPIPIDADGLRIDALATRLADGLDRSSSTRFRSIRTRPGGRCRWSGAASWSSSAAGMTC